jgi:hypothetical protein
MEAQILNVLDQIKQYFDSRENLEWLDQDGVRHIGLSPNLRTSGDLNSFIFGDCSGLYGVISADLYGDVSNLTGELNPDLKGYIPLYIDKNSSLTLNGDASLLTGDVTGLTGSLGWSIYPNEMLFGTLCKDLVGNITGLSGEISGKLTGDVTGLIGKISPELVGDCANLKGTITGLTGDCTGLSGRCSGLTGDCSGVTGDCTGIEGDCTGRKGDLGGIPPSLRPNRLENLSFQSLGIDTEIEFTSLCVH